MILLYTGIFFVLLVYFIDVLLVDRRKLELSKHFNGPIRIPIIGTVYIFFKNDVYTVLKNFMQKYARGEHKIARMWNGLTLDIFIDDPKLLKELFNNPKFNAKGSHYDVIHPLGEGLVSSSGEKWTKHRKIITPAFHFTILQKYFDNFIKESQKLTDMIEKESNGGEPFNIFPVISLHIFRGLCKNAMGCEMNDIPPEYFNAVKRYMEIATTKMYYPWLKIDLFYKFTKMKRDEDECIKIYHGVITNVIEKRRKILLSEMSDNNNNNVKNSDDIGRKGKMCFLDVLLRSEIDGQPLSNEEIRDEVNTFLSAGQDTTTNVTCFTLYLISKHPDVQEKLSKEIEEILGDEELTFDKLNDFKYLEMVIKETMRLYPPAPIIMRHLNEEVDFGSFIAPANANYGIVFHTLFRNPEFFENPDDFVPERFLKEIPIYTYTPFSYGQRNCIGQRYAMTNMKANIISILRKFTLINGQHEEPEIKLHITLNCESLLIGFKPRN